MQKIQITEARKIADRIGAEAVVVIAFDGNSFAITSYGATKDKCARTAKWVDQLSADLEAGKLVAPAL